MADIPHVEQPAVIQLPGMPKASGPRNWAEDSTVRRRVASEIIPLAGQIRDRRQPLNRMWESLDKVWTLEHEEQGYAGRSNVYVPAGKKGAETIVSQLLSGTFPGEDYFGVTAKSKEYDDRASMLKRLLKQRIENIAKIRIAADRYYRQLVIRGNSPSKYYYRRDTVKGRGRAFSKGAGPSPITDKEFTLYDGPVMETVDSCNFYIWPEDVSDPRDAEIFFEDITVSVGSMYAKARAGVYVESEVRAAANAFNDKKKQVDDAKLQAQGMSGSRDTSYSSGGWGRCDITELYCDFDPTAADRQSEEHPTPHLITFSATGQVLRVIENPFWHKRRPYTMGRMGIQQGRVYGTGFVEAIRELNLLLNDQTNQAMDCATYALNPIVVANPDLIQGALPDLEPAVQFLVRDINAAVKFDRPPGDLIQYGSILTAQSQSWINDYIGAPPVLQGGSSPGRAFKTATGIGTAQQNAKVPLQEIVRLSEEETWKEMLFFFYCLDQQFAEEEVLLFFNDGKPVERVDPRSLGGDYLFDWLASSQTANQQVKGSQIIQLLGILGNPGLVGLFQQSGLRINPAPLIKRLYQEVYGFRDVSDVIVEQTLEAQGTPIQQPSAGELPSGEDQSLNGENEDLDGNGEFGAMRMDANGISSALGALGISAEDVEALTAEG